MGRCLDAPNCNAVATPDTLRFAAVHSCPRCGNEHEGTTNPIDRTTYWYVVDHHRFLRGGWVVASGLPSALVAGLQSGGIGLLTKRLSSKLDRDAAPQL